MGASRGIRGIVQRASWRGQPETYSMLGFARNEIPGLPSTVAGTLPPDWDLSGLPSLNASTTVQSKSASTGHNTWGNFTRNENDPSGYGWSYAPDYGMSAEALAAKVADYQAAKSAHENDPANNPAAPVSWNEFASGGRYTDGLLARLIGVPISEAERPGALGDLGKHNDWSIVEGDGLNRVMQYRAAIVLDRKVVLLFLLIGVAAIEVRESVVGLQADGRTEVGNRSVMLPHLKRRISAVVVCFDVSRAQPNCLVIVGDRTCILSGIEQGDPAA